ncbi:hypothetical protein U9M48_006540, partial [Paspalum notatum var. saurae]
ETAQELMAEIDTRPLESVHAAVSIFDRGSSDQSRLSPDRNEEEIVTLTKELASCKLQLEVRESQHKQDTLKVEALQKAVQELADQYEKDCMDAHLRIAQLEAENARIMSRQSEADGECRALRGELDAAKASVAFVLREVEAMETRAILERESTKEALSRILLLNEAVLSSAVAAIKAEEERSVFFQEATLEFLSSERSSSEVVRRQVEMMESMEAELLAKTMEVEYLRSELKQVKEIYVPVSPQEVSHATAVTAAGGCSSSADNDDDVQVQVEVQAQAFGKPLDDDHEAEAEFTFQHPPECFVSEIFRKGCQAVPSDGDRVETDSISGDLVEDKQGAVVQDNEVAEGNSDAQETTGRLVAKTSGDEDHHAIQTHGKNDEADTDNSQEPALSDDALALNLTACHGNDDLPLQDHEETKADASFVLESSRDDFQSVRSDAKDISIADPEIVAIVIAGNQEPRAEAVAAAPTPMLGEGGSDTGVVATEIVSKDDEDEFYTKELEPEPEPGQGKKPDGYVLVSKSADAADKDKQLDAARTEISDLRFSLEETVRRAELAEEAKAALERELREEIRRKHTPSRRRAMSDSEDGWRPAREGAPPAAPTPARPRPTTPFHTPGTSSRAPGTARKGGDDMPTPRCLTLGKVLSMKYK